MALIACGGPSALFLGPRNRLKIKFPAKSYRRHNIFFRVMIEMLSSHPK